MVLIDTQAHKAIDVFYVTAEGGKLNAEKQAGDPRGGGEGRRRAGPVTTQELPDYGLLHGLIGVIVFHAHRDGVFAGGGVQTEFVIQFLGVGETGHGGSDFPLAAIERVLGLGDIVERIGGVPLHLQFGAGSRGGQTR